MVERLVERIRALRVTRSVPIVVAFDGRSGAGKSTLAPLVAAQVGGVVVDGDDFYAGGTGESWDAMSAEQKVDHVIDWRRQRPLLEALRRGQSIGYHPYDWEDEDNDGPAPHQVHVESAPVIILDGVYSARPELADLVDMTVLILIDDEIRRARLLAREGADYRRDWEARWTEAELHYFGQIMPPERFDLVLP